MDAPFQFRRGPTTLIVAAPPHRAVDADATRLGPTAAAARVMAWIHADTRALLHLYALVFDRTPIGPMGAQELELVREGVREALERGDLVVFERPLLRRVVTFNVDEAEILGPESEDEKTWIKIQLLDDLDRPAAGRRYRVELPDGTVREGTLDAMGQAKETGIDHGKCKISFPDLDADVWRPE